ncbi:MAG: aromatic amino acid ammonia-lyase [Planctomycetota bacterium]
MRCEDVEAVGDGWARVVLDPEPLRASCEILESARRRGDPIYGLTTGFGPHVRYDASSDAEQQGANLIAHLAAGHGEPAPRRVVRATLAVRAQTMALGRSGISPGAASAFVALIDRDVCPAIPQIGSVGASGDLIPLAHAAMVLTGRGGVLGAGGGLVPAGEALAAAGLEPTALSARDALAMVNGTAFMTAYAALALSRCERLLGMAEGLTGWAMAALRARRQSLDPRLHRARGHSGQAVSAAGIAASLPGYFEDASRPLQEVYSIRCAPQILGACRDQLAYARSVIETELSGVNDNPVVCGTVEDPAVLHGGNFQGQQVAFAADAMNAAVTQAALLMERQLDVVVNPELNGGAPLLLAWEPGATSGLAGGQITATALAADMRRSATPSAVATMPTNGRNQDVVSMGTMAARVAYEQTERAAAILAVHTTALEQLAFLRSAGRAPGVAVHRPDWVPEVEGFEQDRSLYDDTQRIAQAFLTAAA